MRPSRLLLILVFALAAPAGLFAQRRPPEQMRERTPTMRFDTARMLSDDSTKVRLDVSYRIPFDFFIFVRDSSNPENFPFIARADLTVELLDSNGVSRARQFIRRAMNVSEPPKARGDGEFLRGILSFSLPAGVYTLVTEVADRESDRKTFDNSRKITVASPNDPALEYSDIILTEPFAARFDSTTAFIPISFGGDVPFGSDFSGVFGCRTPVPAESLRFPWTLHRYVPETKDSVFCLGDTLGIVHSLKGAILEPPKGGREMSYRAVGASSGCFSLIGIPLRGETLEQGNYRLSVTVRGDGHERTLVRFFSIRWLTMPFSLRRPELALAATRYIMSDGEYKDLASQNAAKQSMTIEEFWKKRDPTPGTAYNEAMAEYYSRADEASVSFSTVRGINGIQTDRGKVYILYGPPQKTERHLAPSSAPREAWRYPALSRMFVFVDESRSGDYHLFSVDTLKAEH